MTRMQISQACWCTLARGSLQIQHQPELFREFKDSLGYLVRLCLKKKKANLLFSENYQIGEELYNY
jgi:hypothetical protein